MPARTDRHVSEVFVGAAGVGDDVQMTERRAGDDQVVDDAAGVVGEERQKAVVVSQAGHIAHSQTLHELDPVSSADRRLQHVRHVEQRHVLPVNHHVTA